jgi:pilus assembly protein CpaB
MNRTLLILAGALIVAGIAVFYVYADAYVQEETGGPRVPVVAAAYDIPFGEPMRAEWLTVKELPQSYVEDRHLRASDLRRLIGVKLAQSVRAGEAILRTDLSTLSDQQRTLSGEIPPGKRAISIEAQHESGHGGMLRPGDRVDVLLTVGDHRIPNSGRALVVAQNILVLSVGRNVGWRWDDERRQAQRQLRAQVNLQVGLEDAQRLTVAERQGQLRLLLRNPNDVSTLDEPPEVREATLHDAERRADWLRRFALVQRPELESPAEGTPD